MKTFFDFAVSLTALKYAHKSTPISNNIWYVRKQRHYEEQCT